MDCVEQQYFSVFRLFFIFFFYLIERIKEFSIQCLLACGMWKIDFIVCFYRKVGASGGGVKGAINYTQEFKECEYLFMFLFPS